MKLLLLRRHLRLLVALFTFLGAMCIAMPRAQAQFTITVATETSLPRLDAAGNPTNKRDRNLEPEAVSQLDCFADQKIRFSLILTGFEGNATLEAWAGLLSADCKAQVQRSGPSATCWQLATGIPLAQSVPVDIPVRKIMSGASPFTATKTDSTEAACGKVDLTTINVHFLYFPPGAGGGTPTVEKSLPIKVDTVGPLPPSGLRTKPGNTRIQVEWNNISGDAGGISVLTGIKVYCDPAGSVSTLDSGGTQRVCTNVPNDGGPDADADFDAGTTEQCVDVEAGATTTPTTPGSGNAECTSGNLAPTGGSVIPNAEFNAKYECGSITGNTGTTARAESVAGVPLQNGVKYAVSVAATDAFGNLGPLSSPICQTPEETTDFWEDYRKAGGGAGGGYCTTQAPGLPLGSVSAIGIVLVTSLSFLRRRIIQTKKKKNGKAPR